jgi:hypothetical protein
VPRLQQCSFQLEELLKQRASPAAITAGTQALLAAIDELLRWETAHDIDALFDGENVTLSADT